MYSFPHFELVHFSTSSSTYCFLTCIQGSQVLVASICLLFIFLVLFITAKSLQSCPTLCDPIDGSTLGSPVPGILQARTLEWVAISFSSAWKWKVKVKSLSPIQPSATPWAAAHQAPPSLGFSRQEYWSGVPLSSPFISIWYYIKDIFFCLWSVSSNMLLISTWQGSSLSCSPWWSRSLKRTLYTVRRGEMVSSATAGCRTYASTKGKRNSSQTSSKTSRLGKNEKGSLYSYSPRDDRK